jgi:imidazolonepropionase-like amidohydrolase
MQVERQQHTGSAGSRTRVASRRRAQFPPLNYRRFQPNRLRQARTLAFHRPSGQPSLEMFSSPTVIRCALALVGDDLHGIEDAAVVVDGETIAAVGRASEIGAPDAAVTIDASGLTLLPGFIDAHVHIGFADPLAVLSGGVTTVRDLAWPPGEIWPLVAASAEPSFDGPLILAAGQMLTTDGGYPTRAEWAPPGTGRVVDGPDDARTAVAEQVESGASVIKVALNAEVGPTLDAKVLTAIVDFAHERGLKVTGHVFGLAELRKTLGAGMDELAHMLMSPEHLPDAVIGEMVESGMTVVSTLSIFFEDAQDIAIANTRRFVKAGGRLVYGTDLGNAGPLPGIDAREVDALEHAGLSGTDIVKAATVTASSWLRLADRGSITSGKTADLVAVGGDPRINSKSLTDVRMVWRSGRLVSNL